MRKIVILIISYASLVHAQTYTIEHDFNQVQIESVDEFQKVGYLAELNLSSLDEPLGQPDLPVYLYRVNLPFSTTLKSFQIEEIRERKLAGEYRIKPLEALWHQDMESQNVPLNPGSLPGNQFPQSPIEFRGVNYFNGYSIAHFAVYPLRYQADTGELFFIESLTFSIITMPAERSAVIPKELFLEENQKLLSHLKNNQKQSISAQPMSLQEWFVDETGIPLNYYGAGLVDRYVIITSAELQEAFKPLVDWKTRKGVPAIIRTLDWIRNNFPQGIDDAERVRNFLRWSYAQRGTKYVLLGGETELVPTRIITTGGYTFPTDYYFADLDGTWNDDQDDIFGEAVDNLDGYPEIYVSRIPVETADDVSRFISRLFKYEKMQGIVNPDYPGEVLYMAANLSKDDDGKELIMKHIDPQINSSFKRTLITQNGQIGSDPEPALAELNKNYSIMFSENHGLYHSLRPGARGSNIYAYQIGELTNDDPALWYVASCYTNDIAKRSLSEMYLLAEEGGGVAYIGNSSYEYPFSGIYLQKEFFNLAFSQNRYHLAEAHFLSRLKYLGYLSWEGPSRIIVYSTIVLGDAEMPIWTEMPKRFMVQQNQVRSEEGYSLTIEVKDSNSSLTVENALVVLYRENEIYELKRTNDSGRVDFDLANYEAGPLFVTVTKKNYIPYEGMDQVLQHAEGRLRLIQKKLLESDGNGNGQAEAGETMEIHLQFLNLGDESIPSGLMANIHGEDSLISLVTNQISVANQIDPDELFSLEPIHFTINSAVSRDTTLLMEIHFRSGQESLGFFPLSLAVKLPQLQVSGYDLSITGQEMAQHFQAPLLSLSLLNKGQGGARDITATLRNNQAGVSIIDSMTSFGYISGAQIKEAEQPLSFEYSVPLDSVRFTLQIKDYYGKTWNQIVEFNRPEPPSSLKFKPVGPTAIELNWSASLSKDVLGYYIFRREAGSLPLERITNTPVDKAGFFIDAQVIPGREYEYFIQTIDSSGNISQSMSEALLAWPALQSPDNFPLRIGVQAIGSELNGLVVYDFDHDGRQEIVASGAHGVLKILDNQGRLQHSFVDLQGNLTKPAAGNVFGDGRLEVVVSSYQEGAEKNFIYIIDPRTGQLLHSIALGYQVPTVTVLNDLDGDGYDDIIILTHGNNAPVPPQNSRLIIWKSQGSSWTAFPGWSEEGYSFEYTFSLGVPATGILSPQSPVSVIVPTAEGKVYAFHPAVSPNPVWIKPLTGYLNAALSLADLDRDSHLEILVPSVDQDRLYVLNHRGEETPGWLGGKSVDITNPWYRGSPAITANLDEDIYLEVVYAGRDSLHIFEHDGLKKSGWPIAIKNGDNFFEQQYQTLSVYSSPVIADLNQDGTFEIIFITTDGLLHALNSQTGKSIQGFPINTQNDEVLAQAPLVTDLDHDNDLDILFLSHDGMLHVWDSAQKFIGQALLAWSQPYANIRHSGELDTLWLGSPSALGEHLSQTIPREFYLKPNFPNPFNPETTIEFGLIQTSRIELSVYNLLGQQVAVLISGQKTAGVHQVHWNGLNRNGAVLASGIYFYQLLVKDLNSDKVLFDRQGKMILLK